MADTPKYLSVDIHYCPKDPLGHKGLYQVHSVKQDWAVSRDGTYLETVGEDNDAEAVSEIHCQECDAEAVAVQGYYTVEPKGKVSEMFCTCCEAQRPYGSLFCSACGQFVCQSCVAKLKINRKNSQLQYLICNTCMETD